MKHLVGFIKVSRMRMKQLGNVGSGRSTPSENFENGLRLQVISHIKTLNYLSAFLCWALCLHVRPSPFLTRGADETQGDGWNGARRCGMHQRSHLRTVGSSVNFCKTVRSGSVLTRSERVF